MNPKNRAPKIGSPIPHSVQFGEIMASLARIILRITSRSDFILLAVAFIGLGILTKVFLWFIDKQMGTPVDVDVGILFQKTVAPPNTEEVDAINEEINTIMQLDLDLMMNVDNKKEAQPTKTQRRPWQRH